MSAEETFPNKRKRPSNLHRNLPVGGRLFPALGHPVFTPFAELYHFESKSRGLDEAPAKAERYQKECDAFRARYKALIEKGDPYFNPNFSLDSSSFELKY